MGSDCLRLLNTLEAALPLRRPSNLAALAQKILTLGEGILGEIITIVTAAAVHRSRAVRSISMLALSIA
jgi:hypothetical protein